MNKIINNIKSGNYEVVDNQGVSVTEHFIDCLEKELADLEATLAALQQEQISEMQEHQEAMQVAEQTITNLVEDNRASQGWYKKQLAEKDKAIENLRIDLKDWEDLEEKISTKYDKVVEQLAEKEKEIELMAKTLTLTKFVEKEINQDKISFAVEQLEKAKSFCISAENNGWCITHKDWLDIVEYIDNQIKQLKEME